MTVTGSKWDDAKDAILADAAKVAEHSRSAGALPPDQVERLLAIYYRHVSAEDLLHRDPVDVYGAARSHFRLAQERPQGTAAVNVFTPTVEEHGWSCSHTVVEVVTDDMPFLVDSVTMELSRRKHGIHLVVHPQVTVHREITGRLLGVDGGYNGTPATSAGRRVPDLVAESWIHVEIDRVSDPDDLVQIEADLRRVLNDVRESVEDFEKLRGRALEVVEDLATNPPPLPEQEIADTRELLTWLADNHFTFLGYREYTLHETPDGDSVMRAIPGKGLGILRSDPRSTRSFRQMPPEVRTKAKEKRLLILTKANSRSTVHRPAYLDYIGIKTFDESGEVVGERRFLGLFTSAVYTQSVRRIPVLRARTAEVIERSGFSTDSHSGKVLLDILETYPRDELFQVSAEELLPTVMAVLYLQERRRLRLFVRRDDYGRYVSCLVYLPRDRFSTDVRLELQRLLLAAYGGETIDFALRLSESVLARLHFVIRMPRGATIPDLDVAEVEEQLSQATRTWSDDFADALNDQVGEAEAARLLHRYDEAFPVAYRDDFPARTGVADLLRLEELPAEGGLGLSLYEPVDAASNERRFKIYRTGQSLSLSDVLPRLTRMGVEVIDERPYEIETADHRRAWIYDFGLVYDAAVVGAPAAAIRELFQDAFAAVWSGRAESDGFNALVLRAGLNWRQASILRAYAKYMRQSGSTFSQSYIEDALTANVDLACQLVSLFEARFDPRGDQDSTARDQNATELVERIEAGLDDVASLDHDRILRSLLNLVRTTLRTNYFQRDADGEPKPYISFKLDPRSNPELPEPRPQYEIWVYSPRVEGVHLRFGPVARGGLRWSDRREDFRTEVLGLAKAQMVKNTVIVPVGAKGGFFCKQLPDPADRDAWMAEGVACYRRFISGLLDITDNLRLGEVIPPEDVVRHDGDDAYLVVAADKGTASFSDIANDVAKSYGFWLGDAFASGGSDGYDHKAMGITARGAWESVKRHFRELGRDCQNEDFTCVGVGDMSGDVFGNGMLCSRHTRLVAAFDHRHIFLDPDPDPETSYDERRRLFGLPRSSWVDYDRDLISTGGGVYRRTAKSIPLSPQVRASLGIARNVDALTPSELIRAILTAPVDLLWNGGIGTYVKASTESQADAGDKANDAVRVNGRQLRAACVGEGGNLGFTQLGRIEYAQQGGKLTTDFIDNSAGVDTSDHEVNIKVLLDRLVQEGDLTGKQRNELLVGMTDEVAQLVLDDNYQQNVALQNAAAGSKALMHVHADWIRRLEKLGLIDRELEFLPSPKQFRERQAQGGGLTAPELAVLFAYTKVVLAGELLGTSLPDDPYLNAELVAYFPEPIRERFREQMAEHPLRREIITTQVVNRMVNMAGMTFYPRLSLETGAPAEELARAHVAARAIFGADEIFARIQRLDNRIESGMQVRMRLEARTIVERASRWFVQNRRPPMDVAATIEFFGTGMRELSESLPEVLTGRERTLFEGRLHGYVEAGVPEELATRVAALAPTYAGLGIVETANRAGVELMDVARVHFILGERLELGRLLERILALPRQDRWQTTARATLRDDLHNIHSQLTMDALSVTPADAAPEDRVAAWAERDQALVSRTRSTLGEIVEGDVADLARLSVGLRVVRRLLPSAN